MKTLRASFFSLMLVKLIKIKILPFCMAVRMTVSFVEHFRKIIKIQNASTSSFHNPKLSQEK